MPLPNFLIIGPHKAGTTSLHRYLQQHPDVFLPRLKEPRYFSYNPGKAPAPSSPYLWGETRHPIRSWDRYLELFAPVTTEKAIGEASPCYLNDPYAPSRVRKALPGARLIVSLRNPVDRAYSDYLMAVRNGREHRPFMTIVEGHPDWHGTLTYHEPCRRWLARFPREQLKVIRAEHLKAQPAGVVAEVFEFLEVDAAFPVDTSRQFHQSGMPRSPRLHRLLSGRQVQALRPYVPESLREALRPLKRANLRSAPALACEDRERLVSLFRDHILRLEDLLDTDLSDWLTASGLRAHAHPA